MIKIGITGGIGSGKSLVCAIIEHLGFPVFYSDKVAKEILDSNESIKSELKSLFGEEIYYLDKLNRAFLAKKIFSDKSLIQKVNLIVHPRVRTIYREWLNKQNSSLVFNEAAILFETDSYKAFDVTILVTAPEELRINRVIKRDIISKEDVLARMNNQWSDNQKIPLATYVISNDEKSGLLAQVEKVIECLLEC